LQVTFNKFRSVISSCFDDFLFVEVSFEKGFNIKLYDQKISPNPKFINFSNIKVSIKKVSTLFYDSGDDFYKIIENAVVKKEVINKLLLYPVINRRYEFKFVPFDNDSLFIGVKEETVTESSTNALLEQELSKTILLFKDAQRIAQLGYWEYDLATGKLWGTKETRRILKLDIDNPLLSLDKVKSSVLVEDFKLLKADLFESRRRNFSRDLRFTDGDKLKHLVVEGDIEFSRSGKVVRVFGVLRDVTNRIERDKQIDRKLQIEKSISRISLGFIGTENRNEALQGALKESALVTNSERAYLLLLDKDENPTELIQWNSQSCDPLYYLMEKKNSLELLTKKALKLPDSFFTVDRLSDIKDGEVRSFFKKVKSKSLAVYRFKRNESIAFILFLETVNNVKKWDEDDKYLISIAAFLINNQIVEKDYATALIESKRKYKDLFDQMSNGLALFSPVRNVKDYILDLNFLETNRALTQILGQEENELIGKGIKEVFTRLPKEWQAIVNEPSDREKTISFLYGSGDAEKYLELAFFLTQEGKIAVIIKNMTEQKKLEDNLRQAEKLQVVGQLAGGIAHDFNNQLMGILGYGSMLESMIEDEEQLEFLKLIINSAQRSSELTRKLLDFSRKGKFLSIAININDLIIETVSILRHSVDKKIKVRKYLRVENAIVKGDPSQIQNALLNIGLNACDAMSGSGSLTIHTAYVDVTAEQSDNMVFKIKPGKYLQIRFIDTGQGMSKETLGKIFEPFYTTKSNKKGTGMGLAAVFGSVKQHKGGIEVFSELGVGSSFNLYFPYDETLKPSIEIQDSDPQLLAKPGHGTILLLDDEELLVYMLERMLKDEGYNVFSFQEPDDAIKYYKKNWKHIDLVMLDFIMPKKNGTEVFSEMKKVNSKIQAILLSGYSPDVQIQKLTSKGILGFIQKPVDKNTIIKKVRSALAE